MDVSPATDTELLTAWVSGRSEAAFQVLVARYAGLVHMAARRTCGSDDLAAEVSQLVFILLAQKAKSLLSHTSLGGWLHVTAVMQAKNLLRKHQKETRKRQQLLNTMHTPAEEQARQAWQEMQPVLDGALAALSEKDREAIVLRFYRSLSVREIAATLGIATSAAQKRVDRATERLRDKLSRRGCQVGGPLALALVTGFSADAQAAAIFVPAVSAKAIAAAGAAGLLPSTLVPIALMKVSTYVPAAIALLLSAVWISIHHESVAALEKRNDELAARIDQHNGTLVSGKDAASSSEREARAGQPGHPPAPDGSSGTAKIDWRKLAERVAAAKAAGAAYKVNEIRNGINQQIYQDMTAEELLAALREVEAMGLPKEIATELEEMISHPLTMRFPDYALAELTDRLKGSSEESISMYLAFAFEEWLGKDQGAAAAWLNAQIAAGKFESRALDGGNWMRKAFEGMLISSLASTDPAAAGRRLETIPFENRAGEYFGMVKPEDQAAFADLVRTHLSREESLKAIESQTYQFRDSYEPITTYLDNIHATPEEKARCVRTAARNHILNPILNLHPPDFPKMREWADSVIPGSADSVTAHVLGDRGVLSRLGFPEASRLARQYAEAGGGDAILVPFLESEWVGAYKNSARTMAAGISDDEARERILKKLR